MRLVTGNTFKSGGTSKSTNRYILLHNVACVVIPLHLFCLPIPPTL